MDASDRPADRTPVAAIMYEADRLPCLADILAGPDTGLGYFVSHTPDAAEGWVELFANGLTFDLHGLRDGPAAVVPALQNVVGLERAGLPDKRWLTLAPGPHIAGAANLLPVIRVMAMLLNELAKIGPASAIAWLPAHLVVNSAIFERAVKPWLEGGPFPAPVLVSFHREADGSLRTEGLNFLMGQEFLLQAGNAGSSTELPRIAIRLVDWLVAHGPVIQPCQANLAGTGTVLLEAAGGGRIFARCA